MQTASTIISLLVTCFGFSLILHGLFAGRNDQEGESRPFE